MNDRQFRRNVGRIPRLVLHIARTKSAKQTERASAFSAELSRRQGEMKSAGHANMVKKLTGKNGIVAANKILAIGAD